MDIRKYAPSDLDGLHYLRANIEDLADLNLVSNAIDILNVSEGKMILSFVAEENGLLVGFNVGFILPTKVLIPEAIYVDPEYRNRGVAEKLTHALESMSDCEVSMTFFNKSLSEHYSRNGYQISNDILVGIKEIKHATT